MTGSVIEFSTQEIVDAQEALNFHSDRSPFWDSRSGQDHLRVIQELALTRTVDKPFDAKIGKAERQGRESAIDPFAECPYDDERLVDAWEQAREDEEQRLGDEYADYMDPSMRDLYE